tara:strand:- start:103826 stop:104620 length:795 start_codon:yes stop_codon:yes gene_type:complete
MFIKFKLIVISLCLSLFIGCKTKQEKIVPTEKWVSLFNGKDLNDWIVKIKGHPTGENYKNTFIVEDGLLKVNYKEYNDVFNNTFGHIFYNKEFSNYKLRLQYRFTGKQLSDGEGWATANNGVMIHCEDPKNMALNQDFPVSIEVQLLGGSGTEERPTGNVCTPGTHITLHGEKTTQHCMPSNSKTYNANQWVNLEIEVHNDSLITHRINGVEVLNYSKPIIGGGAGAHEDYWNAREGNPLKKGFISLQSESQSTEFKNIEILEL